MSHLVSKKQNTAHVIFIMIKGMKIRAGQVDRTIFRVTIFYLMSCWDKIDVMHHFQRFQIQFHAFLCRLRIFRITYAFEYFEPFS